MASKKQLVPTELLSIQDLPSVDSGFIGFGAKDDGLYVKFHDGSEYKLLTVSDGNVILSGTTPPSISTGRDGDYYINNTDWTIYGPKTTVWGDPTYLKGENGSDGNVWYVGSEIPLDEEYNNGDLFLNSDGNVYVKSNGIWTQSFNIKGSDGNDGIGTASSVGALVNSLSEKLILAESDILSFRDEISGLWTKITFANFILSIRENFDDIYELKNNVVANYYVTNLQELIDAWNDAQTKSIPAKIYCSGTMDFESSVNGSTSYAGITLSGTKQVQIEGVPIVTFKLRNKNFSVYSPLIKNAVFFDPNSTGYIKSLNGGASLDYCIFRTDSYNGAAYIPHIALDGPFVNNSGNVRLNDIYHGTDRTYANLYYPIQPIYVRANSGYNGQTLAVSIRNVDHAFSFDRFANVLITAADPALTVNVTGDDSWKYDLTQPQPGDGLNAASKLKPVSSLHDVRISDMDEVLEVSTGDKVLIERDGKAYLAPKDEVGSTIEYSTSIEADKLSTTKVSAIKTLYDWAVGKFQSVLVSGTNIKTINNTSILGSGNITIEAGSVDYDDLTDKPTINSVELSGNKTATDLHLDIYTGAAAPINPTERLQWLDTTSGIKYEYVLGTWVELGPQIVSSEGSAGPLSSVTASVNSNVGTPEVTVTYDGENADFAFKNLKGEQGEQGEKGDDAVLPAGTVIDPNYVHTDNNYTTADKAKVAGAIQTETDPTVPAWAKEPTKPTYTASEVGLGNVDNTSDANKPISNATQTALNNKVDKVTGSSLVADTEIDKLSEYPEFEDLKFLHKNLTDKNAESTFQHLDTTTEKTTPIDADSFGLWDSVNSTFKRLSVANMLTWFRGLAHTFTQLITFSGGVKLTKILPTSNATGVVIRNAADTEDVFNLDITNKKFSQSDNFSLRTASTNYYKDLEFTIKPNNGTGSIIFKPSSGNDMQFVMPSANNINNIIFGIRNGRAFICNALNNVTSGEFHLGGQSWGSDGAIIIKANKDVGVNTAVPQSKLHVNGGIQCADDTAAASLLKVGTKRYRPAANGSYYEICMQTGPNTFIWHTLAQYTW